MHKGFLTHRVGVLGLLCILHPAQWAQTLPQGRSVMHKGFLTYRVGVLGLLCILHPSHVQAMLGRLVHHLLSAHKRCEVQIVAHYLRNPFALNRETQDLFCEGSTWPSSSADCNVLTWLFMYLEIHHMLQKIATQRLWLLSSCSGL